MPAVSNELARIAETLRSGIGGLGTARLAGEQQKTRGALLDYNLSRNRIEDARAADLYASQESARKLSGLQSEAALRQGQRVATFGEEKTDPWAAFTFALAAPKIGAIYNAEPDTAEDGSFRFKFKDGSGYLWEIDRNKEAEAEAILSTFKASSGMKDQIARWEERKQRVLSMGIPMAGTNADKEIARVDRNISKLTNTLNTPDKMIRVLQGQLTQLEKFGHYPEDIKRIKGEIKYEQSKLMTPAQKLAEKRTVMLHEKQMKTLDLQQQKLKEKGEAKLSPSEKAQKEAKMKDYANNLNIIKTYKTGYDQYMGAAGKVTEEDYSQAVKDNEKLEKWFGELGISYDKNSLSSYLISKGREMQGDDNDKRSETNKPNLSPQDAGQQERYIKLRQQGKSPEEAHRLSLKGGAGGSF